VALLALTAASIVCPAISDNLQVSVAKPLDSLARRDVHQVESELNSPIWMATGSPETDDRPKSLDPESPLGLGVEFNYDSLYLSRDRFVVHAFVGSSVSHRRNSGKGV
jgi:hypothetical protein